MSETGKTCIEEYLRMYAEETPDKAAVIVKDRFVSYRELWELVQGFAACLQSEYGVSKGDRVVVKASQTLSYAISYFAVHLCGAIFVPLEKGLSPEKCAEIIAETGAKVFISNQPAGIDGVADIPVKSVEDLAKQYYEEGTAWDFPAAEDSADIMYTTGTTGKAKGVEVTHSVLLATAENYITGFELKEDNVIAVPGPMNHVNALRKLYMSIMNGSTIIILNGLLSMKALFHALDEQGVTSLCLPPASLRTIWHFTGDKLADYADRIDFVECSTAPVTETDKKTLRSQLPNSRLYNNYGLSECGAMVMYDFNRYPDKPQGCVGKPMVNSHVIIVDEDRNEIRSSPDNRGIVANSGPINMKGYWNAPEQTAQVMADGYIYTSDIGFFDDEGFLYIVGRKNDTINVGGLKVEPAEIEEKVLQIGSIEECICVPVPDDITENALKVFVVMKEGEEFDEEAITSFLTHNLPSYQVPRTVETIDRIPKNYVGKPDRNAFEDGFLIKRES